MISFSETIKRHPQSAGELLIGVPTLHRYDHLRRCLNGILASAPDNAEIVVIDNGGNFKNDVSSRIQVVVPPCNLGAPASWNLIGDLADGREFMIFNDDVVPGPATIRDMMRTPGWMVCSYAFGAFLVRQLLWTTVGRFDEFLWPMYWEDTDYQARMRLLIAEDVADDGSLPPCPLAIEGNPPTPREGGLVTRLQGGILVTSSGDIEHLGGGSQTKQEWMHPWINRTRDRFLRKWASGNDPSGIKIDSSAGHICVSKRPFDGEDENPVLTYWAECHQHGWETYMDAILDFAGRCESAAQIGLHVGRFTLPFLRSTTIKVVHCFDWNKLEEWDFLMRLDEYAGRKIHLWSRYDPRRAIPEIDMLFIDEAHASAIAKRAVLKQLHRVRQFVAFLGPNHNACPFRENFERTELNWRRVHFNNGLSIFQKLT